MKQLSIFIENKRGTLLTVLNALKGAGIQINMDSCFMFLYFGKLKKLGEVKEVKGRYFRKIAVGKLHPNTIVL